ncbi:hypothetical protein CDL12_09737 [Handroanthus impetiginosus]|uniref:Transcription factor, Myb superfamily n=1 Tax=Handroanthus impetiginosus TaxID=429701 RepID=A0A2G9HJ92_9LAMI|nr:hypothetical protein CDL12_09737 [Handroanthus impetiginosus]
MAVCEDSDRIKGPWTPEEDEILQKLVQQHGERNWAWISRSIPGRSRKSCRMRWCNQLSPVVDHRPFTAEEDEIILNKQAEVGNKWVTIAKLLNGRSENAVKNRWNSNLKRKFAAVGSGREERSAKLLRKAECVDVSVANGLRSSSESSSQSESEISGTDHSSFPGALRAEPPAAAVVEEEISDDEFTALTLRLPGTRRNSAVKKISDNDLLASHRRHRENGETPPPSATAAEEKEKPSIELELVAVMKKMIRMEVRNYLSELIRERIRSRK